jgi:hypothetical protein
LSESEIEKIERMLKEREEQERKEKLALNKNEGTTPLFNFRLPPELRDKVQLYCSQKGVNTSELIRRLLIKELKKEGYFGKN